jgi:hypothetical protein
MEGHVPCHIGERGVGRDPKRFDGHGFFHCDLRWVDVTQGLDEMQIALRDDANQASSLQHRQVTDAMNPHGGMSRSQCLPFINGDRAGRHHLPYPCHGFVLPATFIPLALLSGHLPHDHALAEPALIDPPANS